MSRGTTISSFIFEPKNKEISKIMNCRKWRRLVLFWSSIKNDQFCIFSKKKSVNCEWSQKYQASPSHLDCSLHLIFENPKPTKIDTFHFSSTTINHKTLSKKTHSHYYFVFMKIIQVEIKMENFFMKNFYFPLLCEN
jgi:hypothetical protein